MHACPLRVPILRARGPDGPLEGDTGVVRAAPILQNEDQIPAGLDQRRVELNCSADQWLGLCSGGSVQRCSSHPRPDVLLSRGRPGGVPRFHRLKTWHTRSPGLHPSSRTRACPPRWRGSSRAPD